MAVRMSLFIDDPEQGPIDESEFGAADLATLLDPDNAAVIEMTGGRGEVIIRGNLDDLIAGVCLAGGKALATGGSFTNVSFAGFDPARISANGDMALFECEGDTLRAPLGECLAAMRALAGRYVDLLERAFPDDQVRRARFADFARG